jgi:hypothetical protein
VFESNSNRMHASEQATKHCTTTTTVMTPLAILFAYLPMLSTYQIHGIGPTLINAYDQSSIASIAYEGNSTLSLIATINSHDQHLMFESNGDEPELYIYPSPPITSIRSRSHAKLRYFSTFLFICQWGATICHTYQLSFHSAHSA